LQCGKNKGAVKWTNFFRIVVDKSNPFRKWKVIRTKHPTKADYLLAEFYDRGAIKLFIEALKARGFKEEE
jgi:hypothetical protein